MKTYRLADFVDDGRLVEVEDAEFFARKLGQDDVLDFAEIREVSPAYLDALLAGHSIESLDGRIVGVTGDVDRALADWAERQAAPKRIEQDDRAKRPRKRADKVSRQIPQPVEYVHREVEGERFTPTRLVSRLRAQLMAYIESAYPLSDATLIRSRRKLLEEAQGGHLLAQEPYVETTPRYKQHKGDYRNLGLQSELAEFFSDLSTTPQEYSDDGEPSTLLYPGMYKHQARAFQAFLGPERKDTIVATGTGSGKTECFLVPMLGLLHEEARLRPESFKKPGVRVLILYPMNALVNDQLSRLRRLFGDRGLASRFPSDLQDRPHPTFGMYTGRTPYPGPRDTTKDRERVRPLLEYYENMSPELRAELQRLGRYPAKDLDGFYAKHLEERKVYQSGERAGQEYTRYHWDKRLHTQPGDRELLTRQEMVSGSGTVPGHAPDILITNYSMLEYMLLRPFERPIFRETAEWLAGDGNEFLLVLDEAHMYRGARGAEVGFLLRRLRARLGINDRPDKLRVICTSASLGNDENALENVRKFAADLTGKKPDDFEAITGERDIPTDVSKGDHGLCGILAGISLDHLHANATPEELHDALKPVFENMGSPCNERGDDDALLRHLYETLNGHPLVNLLLRETAGEARSTADLAQRLFGDHPDGKKAVEVLVTLGTIARKQKDEPGLIPTRIHAMFRGLHALYACINPVCKGRQDGPGKSAIVGKLFTQPRTTCDDCGSRVFELASCRYCGSPYLFAYTNESIDTLDFLWGETEGTLTKLELLTAVPRYAAATEEVRVHMATGYLDRQNSFPEEQVRSLWLYRNAAEEREAVFGRCAMCQPPGSRQKSRISDFRTKGEQPFTALIEAQFAEQPPQKSDPRLPNQGRKVLVFSDGRQKAARLAPALEHSHARDLFRQVLAIAADELQKQVGSTSLHSFYAAIVWVCVQRGINLFPAPDETEFQQHLVRAKAKSLKELVQNANDGLLRPTQSYAQQLFGELTDRFFSLNSLALATVEENPLMRGLFSSFPSVGLDDAAVLVVFRNWLRLQLEARRFLPPGADISNLGEGWERPEGMDANNDQHLIPGSFENYLRELVRTEDDYTDVVEWFREFVRGSGLFGFEGDRYFLQPSGLSLNLKLDAGWLRCSDCGRIYAEALADLCPSCLGPVVEADTDYLDARTGFYREHVRRAFDLVNHEPFGLAAAEHSAQLTGREDEEAFNKTERYELRFQDTPIRDKDTGQILPPVDVLSCTTTMEVGIDIGTLSGVALRNVPPHVANYQQRAGRAGRRGRSVASVITYAHGTSHDAHFYEEPSRIITGDVVLPAVYIENQRVLRRHISAYLVQRFFHETVTAGSDVYQLFEALGTVEQFLSDQYPCSLEKLEQWLRANEATLLQELRHWAPDFSYGRNQGIPEVAATINSSIDELVHLLSQVLPIEDYKNRDNLEGLRREGLERQLEERLLDTLIGRALLPRYAFPMDVVSFWVSKRKWKGDPAYKRTFEYEPQRDLQIALSEYAPGSSLTIDKWRFASEAIYSPYAPEVGPTLERAHAYIACKSCGYVSLQEQSESLAACPCCGHAEMFKNRFITPEGFAPDINAKREIDRGQGPSYAGRTTRAQLEVQEPPSNWERHLFDNRLAIVARSQNLVTVNKGVGDRGFMICPECGRTEPRFGPGFTNAVMMRGGVPRRHDHPLEMGRLCDGQPVGPYYLGHRFPTDVLLFRLRFSDPVICAIADRAGRTGRPGRTALTSLVEAVSLAGSQILQIDEGELAGNWSPVLGGGEQEVYMFLYDLLPGGAGYTKLVRENIEEVLDQAEKLLAGCDCESSCYRCLRHYANNFYHASLDRTLALALLRYVRHGEEPAIESSDRDKALSPLVELIRLKGLKAESDVGRDGVRVPLVVTRDDASEVWVDLHHPLLKPEALVSEIRSAADSAFLEFTSLDAFTAVHDLPGAVDALQL